MDLFGGRDLIGQILLEKGYVDDQQLEIALGKQDAEEGSRRLGEILVQDQIINEDQLLEGLSEQYDIPYVKKIDRLDNDASMMGKLPIDFAKQHLFCPCYTSMDELVVAINDPLKVHLLDDLRQLLGLTIKPVLTSQEEIELAINECYGSQKDLTSQVIKDLEEADYTINLEDLEGAEDLLDMANKAPVIRFVNSIIYHAVNDSASDIHIEPAEHSIRIRFRVDGRLLSYISSLPPETGRLLVSRIKVFSGLDIAEQRAPQDGRMQFELSNFKKSILKREEGSDC